MKNKWIFIIGILFVIAIAGVIIIYFFVYNKPHKDYAKAKADYSIEASELYNEFKANQASASTKYNGKVVQIHGSLNSVENADSLIIAVFSFEQGMFGDMGIRCAISPSDSEALLAVAPGTSITLKGLCTGYNETDVIMEHGSLIKK